MRIPNMDTSLYVTLSAGIASIWLGAFMKSESIQAIGGLFLLLGISHVVFVVIYAVIMAIRNRKK